LTLWLSMIAMLGLFFRPALRRISPRRVSLIRRQRPELRHLRKKS
jgi:hypothetical protein